MMAETDQSTRYPGVPIRKPGGSDKKNDPFPAMPYENDAVKLTVIAYHKKIFDSGGPSMLAHDVNYMV